MGIYCAKGISSRNISSRTTACMMPATGVRPPLLMLVMVRAMAPVAGIPPKMGERMLAIPCPTSSWLESWRSPMTPSATVAESRDSMAPSTAMVMAGDTSCLMAVQFRSGTFMPGSSALMEKRSPMVSTLVARPYCFSRYTPTVITMMAMSEPGHFVRNPGRQGDDGHAHQTDTRSPPVDGSEVVYVDNPFLDEVCREHQ